jgi:hypothetical protein
MVSRDVCTCTRRKKPGARLAAASGNVAEDLVHVYAAPDDGRSPLASTIQDDTGVHAR